ncbi:MAG: monovalent cation/H+ antiporter subunit D family protein [Planctomycetaceae bacterium]|nr:monovalent cation/H+ antiporter subunit D family protein [Planctomycetaceae bacterium]
MEKHLPILQIIVPLLSAPLCVLVRTRQIVMAITITVCWLTFGIATWLLFQTLNQGVLIYRLGNFPPTLGIELRVDALSGFVLWFVAGIGATVITYAPQSLRKEIPLEQHYLFCTMYLMCLTGLLGITITGDLFNLFVFLEVSSLSTYALISLGKSRKALLAAFQYLVMGTIGATFILIGIGLAFELTGSLNMVDLARLLEQVTAQGSNRTILVSFAFISVGVSLKMALFPLHLWLPNAYSQAPSVVTAFIAATATKVSVYVLLRVIFTIFKPGFAVATLHLDRGLMILSIIGIFVASTTAIFQRDLKRMLAYSSIAQVGYMALAISLATNAGLTAGIVHLFNHALIKGGLFMAVGCFAMRLPSLYLDDLRGIGRRMPLTTFAWVLGGLGLIGVPLTAGFISKWYLITAAFEANFGIVAALVLISSLLSLIYVWRFVEVAYFAKPEDDSKLAEAPLAMLLPTYAVIIGTLIFGIWTTYSVGIAEQAARAVLGVAS